MTSAREKISTVLSLWRSRVSSATSISGRTSCGNYRDLIKKTCTHQSVQLHYEDLQKKNEQLPPKTFQRRISPFHKEPPTHSSTDWAQTYRGSPTPPFPVVLLLICCFIIFSNFFSLIFLFSGPGCLALLRLQQQSYGAREHCGSVTSGHFHKLFTGAGKLNLCVRARVLLGL